MSKRFFHILSSKSKSVSKLFLHATECTQGVLWRWNFRDLLFSLFPVQTHIQQQNLAMFKVQEPIKA